MPKPTLPDTVDIGPATYKVVRDDERCRDAGVDFGFVHITTCEIVLAEKIADGQMRDTLLHEILHAVCGIVGLQKGGDKALIADDDEEERLVSALCPFVLMALRSNPELVRYLTT